MFNLFIFVFTISLTLLSIKADVLCPDGFEFLSYEGKEIALRPNFGKAYITFGRPGFYSLSIISIQNKVKSSKFLCDENNLGKVINVLEENDAIEMGKKGGFFKHSKPKLETRDKQSNVCCVCSLGNADNIQMLLFPTEYTDTLSKQLKMPMQYHTRGVQWIEYTTDASSVSYDVLMLSTKGTECNKLLSDIGKKTIKESKNTCSKTFLQDIGQFYFKKELRSYALDGKRCYPSWEICNTKNPFSLTVFILSHIDSKSRPIQREQYIKAAYSMTGIFDVTTLFSGLIKPFTFASGYRIGYLSMEDFYKKLKKNLPEEAQTKATVEWRLAALCAACPEIEVHVTVSEKKATDQKQRVQHALKVNVKANWKGGAGMAEVGGELGLGWTGSFMNELRESLQEGTSVKFKAKCNGFYLYHFDVEIGSKQAGFSTISTRYFYCTDRPYPPICVPHVTGYKAEESNTVICQGYDTDHDFGVHEENERYKAPWRSFHSGRPKPLALFQNMGKPIWKPPFV